MPATPFAACLHYNTRLPPDEASRGESIVVELPQDNVLWFDPNHVASPTVVTMAKPTLFGWRESVPFE
ncbi:MAG: hypothetical protein JNK05_12185 [Myxococcales bacterium]|nr:hypothetical protein [Myxococcales bacterium]